MALRRNKIPKIAGGIALSLLALLLISVAVIWIKIPGWVIHNLEGYTEEKTEGAYTLSIGSMNRKFFPFSIKFSDVTLAPCKPPLTPEPVDSRKTFLTLDAREILLENIDLNSLVFNRAFVCRNIRITKPAVKLEEEEFLQPDTLQVTGSMISEIRPLFNYLNRVDIKKIEFEEASFGFFSAMGDSNIISRADRVSVDVLGFKTDAQMIQRQKQFFETEDVLIRMNDFRNDMGDSIHVLTIDTLLYSLKTTDIRAAGFKLFPELLPAAKNHLEVTVPQVYVKSRSITRFALNDSLKIRYLEFNNPEIRFYQKENPAQLNLEDLDNFDLYELVQNHFTKMEVDSFYLNSAHLEIFRQPDREQYRQQYQSVDIVLNGFLLDSASARNKEKLFHADNIEMQVAGYHLRLEDDEHHFRADSMFVSTFTNRLGVKKIHIHPENISELSSRTEVDIECEELNIEEVDLRNLYHTRSLPTSKIEVIEPDVQLLYRLEKEKRQKEEGGGLLFELVTDYLQGVYSNLVYIERGRLDIKNMYRGALQGYFEANFNFSLTDFSLDSASVQRTDKFFYATNFDLRFSDYHMRLVDDLHKLDVGQIFVSSINQQVRIENLNLHPVLEEITRADMERFNRSELYTIFVPQINLAGVDLRNAFFNKKLYISNFSILNPEINFENFSILRTDREKMELTEFYQLVFNYLEDFDIRQFSVPNGKLTWVNHTRRGSTTSFDNEFSASLENFRLNEDELHKDRLFFSDNFDVTIKDQEFALSDSVHVLKGSEIKLSSVNQSVQVNNALLFPLITSSKYDQLNTTYQVTIPQLNISGFDFREAWYSQAPEIDIIELVSPRFQIYSREGATRGLDLNAYRFPMPSFVESLKLNEFKILNGQATTYQTSGLRHSARAGFSFSLSMPGTELKNDSLHQIEISSKNIQLTISGFKAPLDELHNLDIGTIGFDRERKVISVEDLKVSPFMSALNNNVFNISAPAIMFSEFDLNEALNNNNFEFRDILVKNPDIFIEINREMKDDTLEFLQTLDLYPYVEKLVNRIAVDNLRLQNANLHFNWLQKQLFNNKINLRFQDIRIGENQPPANMLNSKEFEISTTGLSAKSNDGLYLFSADSLIYNSAMHKVSLRNIAVKPGIERNQFPLQTGFQTDVAEAQIAYVELQDINERRWLQDNILDAGKLEIGPAEVSIFRNKRFPFNPKQRPAWPQDLIKNLKQPFMFDSVLLMPSQIRYSELMGISDQPGFIEFNDVTFAGSALSNIEHEIRKNGHFHLNAKARLLNHAQLGVQFTFDLLCPDYSHSATGMLEPMPLYPLNSMITKTDPLKIEEGFLNRLEFDLSFNNTLATGQLYLGYDNLKIAVLDYSGDEIQKDRFASFLANRMVIQSQNPKSGELLPVAVSYPRDEQRSVLNYWWKSIYSGARKILGMER